VTAQMVQTAGGVAPAVIAVLAVFALVAVPMVISRIVQRRIVGTKTHHEVLHYEEEK